MPYYPEKTVSKLIYFKDKDDAAVNPDSNTCTIYDPTGESQATPTLSKITDGIYEMNYNLPADAVEGEWSYIITGVIGTYKGIEKFYFKVDLL